MAHAKTECEGCGGHDDHPKLHYAAADSSTVRSYHHDCLPASVERDVTSHEDSHPQHAAVRRIINAAKKGTRGDKLRTFILADHDKVTAPAVAEHHAALVREGQEASNG